jgi:hypothetical protein
MIISYRALVALLLLVLLTSYVCGFRYSRHGIGLTRQRLSHLSSGRADYGYDYDDDDARVVIDSILESTLNNIYGRSHSARSQQKAVRWIDCWVDELEHYYSLYGNVLVPPHFEFEEGEHGETERRRSLGAAVARIRQEYFTPRCAVKPDDMDTLRRLGFEFKHSVAQYKLRLHELSLFKRLEGSLLVRRDYRVPFDDPRWPRPHHGVKLGQVVKNIRNKRTFHEYRSELEALGLLYDGKLASVLLAIETWNRLQYFSSAAGETVGINSVPYRWKVPDAGEEGCDKWPTELHGMRLGAVLYRIRKKGAFHDHREAFARLGLDVMDVADHDVSRSKSAE